MRLSHGSAPRQLNMCGTRDRSRCQRQRHIRDPAPVEEERQRVHRQGAASRKIGKNIQGPQTGHRKARRRPHQNRQLQLTLPRAMWQYVCCSMARTILCNPQIPALAPKLQNSLITLGPRKAAVRRQSRVSFCRIILESMCKLKAFHQNAPQIVAFLSTNI